MNNKEDSSPIGIIVGAIVAVFVCLAMVIIIFIIIFRRSVTYSRHYPNPSSYLGHYQNFVVPMNFGMIVE